MNNPYPCSKCMYGIQNSAAQSQESPMMEQLESMYPKIYFIILPHVKHHCDDLEGKHGSMHIPDREEIQDMIEDIYKKVEKDLRDYDDDKHRDDSMSRQYRPRRLARDLVGIILINELLNRRRPYLTPYYPPYYSPYPYYGGYPNYLGYYGY